MVSRYVVRVLPVLLSFSILLMGSASIANPWANAAIAQSPGKTVNLEIIVDSSGSMGALTDTGAIRMDAAKTVLKQVISEIPDVAGVNVGLRVYGHLGDNTEAGRPSSCVSSDLLVPMSGVDTDALNSQVDLLRPVGWTPIGFSLLEAEKDFLQPASPDVVNAIVVVTDGLETCDADPVAIAGQLNASDAEIVTHVIGFGTTAEEQAILSGIAAAGGGQLLSSANAGQLMSALFQILEDLEVVETSGNGESRDSPLGIGRAGTVADYQLSVLSVIPNANDVVALENQFNAPPAEGNQFFLARIAVTYTGSTTGTPAWDLNFHSVGDLSVSYTIFNNDCGVYPDQVYNIPELFTEGSAEFNVCWQIASADQDSLIMYVDSNKDFNAPPTWFSLGNPIAKPAAVVDKETPSPTTGEGSLRGAQFEPSKVSGDDSSIRDASLAMGETGTQSDFQIKVVSTSPLANDIVAQTNQFNDPPAPGKQFFIARIAVTYTGSTSGNPAYELNFQAVGDLNTSYTTFNNDCGVYPEQQYEQTELFTGGSTEFNVCWEIDSADQDSLQMYVESFVDFNAVPVWFALV